MKSPGGRLSSDPKPNNENAAKQWREAGQSDFWQRSEMLVRSQATGLPGSRAGAKRDLGHARLSYANAATFSVE